MSNRGKVGSDCPWIGDDPSVRLDISKIAESKDVKRRDLDI